ncbi:PLP dependent protein [Giardia lamblia P15]|uniref:Pyridoxal phosphate homeostasis protein n=1 Tax=Giardia intestinalis (strain P15) TaxID=658858 RepID=E1F184_GIAIA|nr:PLP dependent protein [Giardia lamblia P15]
MSNIAGALRDIKAGLGHAKLVAVSKTKPVEAILEAYAAGQRLFGENYVQELVKKTRAVQNVANDIEWHFIGHLQTNKARDIASIPNCVVQTVDSDKLARRLSDLRPGDLDPLRVMIQINTSGELTKSGCTVDGAIELAQVIGVLPRLRLIGLMTIGAPNSSADSFQALIDARNVIEKAIKLEEKLELSMGMSSDYQLAVRMGADYVRVGSAIFGERTYPQ